MTAEGPIPGAPNEYAPEPLSLPGAKAGRRRGAAVWVALGLTTAVALVCGVSYLAARTIFEPLADLASLNAGPIGSSGVDPASVWWSGEGRFVVLQEVNAKSVREVVVLDVATGKTRTLEGFRVVGVEPHAPRIWIVPDSEPIPAPGSEVSTGTVTDIAWDGIDSPPGELLALRLDKSEDARSDVDARWTPWPGAAGYAASAEIDVNKGGCPGAIRFSRVDSSLNAWSAKVPTDVATFEPIGWSPSGEYFAVISQLGPMETLDAQEEQYLTKGGSETAAADAEAASVLDGYSTIVATARVVVFRAEDGSVAAARSIRIPIREANSGPARAVWSASEDALVLMELDADEMPVVKRLDVESGSVARIDDDEAPWADAYYGQVWIAGVDGTSTLIVEGGSYGSDVFALLRTGTSSHLGMTRGSLAARWSAAGGLLSLEDQVTDGMWRVHRSDAGGGGRTEVLSAPGPDGFPAAAGETP